MKIRRGISGTLWLGGVSLGFAGLAGLLSWVLSAMGDRVGSAAVRGVALVAVSSFVLAFVTLVILLAWAELNRSEVSTPPDQPG